MLRYFFSLQFIIFLSVGLTAATLNWVARWILSNWIDFSLSIMIAYGIGMSCAFLLNKMFVFGKVNRPVTSQARDFFIVNMLTFPIVYLAAIMIDYWLHWLGFKLYTKEIAHAIALGLPMVITFLIYKFHIFRSV